MLSTPRDTKKVKVSRVEKIKERSDFLREPLLTELHQDTTHFTEDAIQVLKFHGSYQQDNRDNRAKGQEKDYQMMLRTSSPGGFIPPELYLAMDRLSEKYGNQTLRATTRQAWQMHGILKKNLKTVIADILNNVGSTLSACGDVNRNVMATPAPYKNKPAYQYAWEYADKVASLLAPQSGAYYEIWLDGEKAITAEEDPEVKAARMRDRNGTNVADSPEPIYGTHFLPKKFKICVTVPGDNSIDVFTHDISLVVMTNDRDELEGFNVLVGGGMGRTHNKEETFARTSDQLGYVSKEEVFDFIKAIVATQRDYGDRSQRRHARMKYLLHDWGLVKFRAVVESYFGKEIEAYKELPEWKYEDYLGWHEQGDGKLFLGLAIENGRVVDKGDFKLKTALRKVIEQFNIPMRLTPNHNAILYEIEPEHQAAINELFIQHGVQPDPQKIDSLVRYSMACPAMPLCGLAVTESERAMPTILARIRYVLNKVGLPEQDLVIRMTGCPNGCARPYMAELGLVGSAPDSYQIWLGGTADQTKLARPYLQKMHIDNLEEFLAPLFVYYRDNRHLEEGFGAFCDRVGFDQLRQLSSKINCSNFLVVNNVTYLRNN